GMSGSIRRISPDGSAISRTAMTSCPLWAGPGSPAHLAGGPQAQGRHQHGPADRGDDACQVGAGRSLELLEEAAVVRIEVPPSFRVRGALSLVQERLRKRLEREARQAQREQELVCFPCRASRGKAAESCEHGAPEEHGRSAED